MIPVLLAAFLLGLVAGLRTFTAPAVLWLLRHSGIWAVLLGIAAVLEYAGDVYPKTPSRTAPPSLIARLISGGFVGWSLSAMAGGSTAAGAIAGVLGAAAGTYGGAAARARAIAVMGLVPSGILEDVVAIALAIVVVTHT